MDRMPGLAYASAMTDPSQQDAARAAREALARAEAEGETVGGSALARAARRAGEHFAARDATGADGATDPIELWGRRIGRALSLLGVIGLSLYLYVTYVAR
ncbi:MAG: hypothetical protein M5U07_07440 [Xanthobacteraceae bacterium]|nr:hypothetical protein [Xanthobacteraceae bacterium]